MKIQIHSKKIAYQDNLGVFHVLAQVTRNFRTTIENVWLIYCSDAVSIHKTMNTFGEYEFTGELKEYAEKHNLSLTKITL